MSITNPTAAAEPAASTSKSKRDTRKLVRTGTPGVFKRVNANGKTLGYVAILRGPDGKPVKECSKTLDGARAKKREREADRDRGEWKPKRKLTLRAYLREWITTYSGTGKRGFREGTRQEYDRLLNQYAHAYFPENQKLVDVTPHHLARFVSWLTDEQAMADLQHRHAVEAAKQVGKPAPKRKRDRRRLSDSSIANIVIPVRAALATAQREGLIRHNPAQGLALPYREQVSEDDDEQAKALSRSQLEALLALTPERHRLLFEVLASCGLRISEAIGLQRKHLQLDGSKPQVRVRRAIVRGRIEPPKSKHGRRAVAIPQPLVFRLRAHLADQADQSPDALVFPSERGTPIDPDNLRARVLKPLAGEVGAPWAAFHTLRHTFASMQLARGCNLLALSRALGHHSPAFTLTRYCHLLEGDEAPALDLSAELATERELVAA